MEKNDKRTIYNMVYRDGRQGAYYIKRFNIASIIRDREYDLTQGTKDSRVVYFTVNPNGEAEVIKVALDPACKRKKLIYEKDFSEIGIKSRTSKGNLLSKFAIQKISLKSHGHSTLGGRKVWFDPDVKRLNYDEHGQYLGEFNDDDRILVVLTTGEYYLTNFDVNNHYEDNIMRIEKFQPDKVWTAVVYNADQQGYPYLKRFLLEGSKRKQSYLGENPNNQLVLTTDEPYPRIRVTLGGPDEHRPPLEIECEEFVAVKGFKANGKRITNWNVASIEELEALRKPEPEPEEDPAEDNGEETVGETVEETVGKAEETASTASVPTPDEAPSDNVPTATESPQPTAEEPQPGPAKPTVRKKRKKDVPIHDEPNVQLNLFGDDDI